MSGENKFTSEQLQKELDSLLSQLADEQIINWEKLETAETELLKTIEISQARLIILKDSQQRIFLDTLKTLKKLDAKDILSRVKSGKLDQSQLQSIIPFISSSDNKIQLNVEELKKQSTQNLDHWMQRKQTIESKLKELNEFLEGQLQAEEVKKQYQQFAQDLQQPQQVEENKNQQTFSQLNTQDLKPADFSYDKINEIASKIQIATIPNTNNLINTKTFNQLMDGAVELASTGFVESTQKNRKQRRQLLPNDPKKYIEQCIDYVKDIDNILNSAQEKLCEKLDITSKRVEESLMLLMERGLGQHILEIQTMSRLKIKESLPKLKKVNVSQMKDILRLQIQVLGEKRSLFTQLINSLPNDPDSFYFVTMVINLALADQIYDILGFEEEDFSDLLMDPSQIANDPDFMEIMTQLQYRLTDIIQSTELGQQMQQMSLQQ